MYGPQEMLDADPVVAIILEHRKLNKLLGSLNGHLEQATKWVTVHMHACT
jgi:hypothetical protein